MHLTTASLSQRTQTVLDNKEKPPVTRLAEQLDKISHRFKDPDERIPPAETWVVMHVHAPTQVSPLYSPRFENFVAAVEAAETIMDCGQEARCFRPWDGAAFRVKAGPAHQGELSLA